jgi:hypothetical protein
VCFGRLTPVYSFAKFLITTITAAGRLYNVHILEGATMKNPSKRFIHLFIALGSVFGYAVVFLILHPSGSTTTAALIVIPTATIGWLTGVSGGLLFGILGFPLNAFLFNLVGETDTANDLGAALIAQFAFILIGVGAGWIRRLIDRVQSAGRGIAG